MIFSPVMELWSTSSSDEVQTVIRAVYKQVLGNPHVMDNERLVSAESQLCDRSITVRDFVRAVAQSDFYRSRYFESVAPYRFVELNFLHLLGRAPQDQREVSEHIVRTVAEGYGSEINSYIDSAEYESAFGENVVPYYRGRNSATNSKQVGYNRMFLLDRGPAQSDSAVSSSQLVYSLGTNTANAIHPSSSTVIGSGTEKRFKIVVSGSKAGGLNRTSITEYVVSIQNMTSQIQRISRSCGKIVKIVELL